MQTTVLLLVVAVALCGAHHIHIAENVTCSGEGHVERAAHLAVHHINDNHHHGYAFNLTKVNSSTVDMDGNECTITLELSLEETKCHFTNPKHYEDCELRRPMETEVTAECKVVLHFRAQGASVHSYHCDTKQDDTLGKQCPDCPKLSPLNDTAGLSIVHRAVRQYNVNNATEHYFVLRDVGRIKTAYVPPNGTFYITEFAMVETRCRTGTKIVIEACRPLCPDRARHVFCSATGNLDAITDLDCETYPAVNHTELAPGEREPLCPYHYEHATLPSHKRIHLIEEVHPAPTAADHEDHPAPSATAHEDHPAPSATAHEDHPAPSATAHEDHPAPSATAHEDHPAPSATAHEDHPAPSATAHEDHPAPSATAHEDHPAPSATAHEDHPAPSATAHEDHPAPTAAAHEDHPAPIDAAHEDHPAPSAAAHEDHPAPSVAAHEDHPAHSHAAHEDHPAHSHAAHEDHPAHSHAAHEVYPARTFICIEKVEDPAIHTICDWPRIPLPQ